MIADRHKVEDDADAEAGEGEEHCREHHGFDPALACRREK